MTQKSVSIGFGYQPNPGKNLLGFGLNWGQPNEDAWEPGLYDQYTAELFNRWQVSNGVPGTFYKTKTEVKVCAMSSS